jgi:hypothetical protein
MGARFLAAALAASTLWYAWHWHASKLSIRAISLRVIFWSFLAAGAGKIAGIIAFRFRSRII